MSGPRTGRPRDMSTLPAAAWATVALCPVLGPCARHARDPEPGATGAWLQAAPGRLRQDGLMDPVSAARAFVAEKHPDADAAILGGSTARARSTPTSDLDIVILYRDGADNYAETSRHAGWIVEAFVHTPSSLAVWYARERAARCAVLGDLCAQGVLLADRGPGGAWQREAQLYMERGPDPLTDQDRGLRRYELSSSLDDLRGSAVAAESFAIAAEVFLQSVELLLLQHGKWLGKGKWAIRRLDQLPGDESAAGLRDWAASPARSPERLIQIADKVLEGSGGYLMEGFLRGSRPGPGVPHD